ncbi:MAG: protein translocase subunit SecDF, partial [Lachnospiraceae bacterium]|nr:protein translocase subunit SecDF [Lachnospiraceae bacterium]
MNSKTKGLLKLLGAIVVIGIIGFIAIRGFGENRTGSASDVSLGLDLAGGVSVTYEIVDKDATDEQISDTVYKMQLRSQNFSNEAQVSTEGSNRITVSIPSVTDADAVLKGLGSAGNIYFIYGMGSSGQKNIATSFNAETSEYKSTLLRSMDSIIADGDVVIDGKDIASAKAVAEQDQYSGIEYKVSLELNAEGREKFANATAYSYGYVNASGDDALRNIIAIVYDNEVVSAPHVAAVITDGKAVISGQKTSEEASLLA